jgi:hypothetical protein
MGDESTPTAINQLSRQTGATFGTAGFEHQPSAFCTHASAKTVTAGTYQFAGLKSSFHDDFLKNCAKNKNVTL